MKEENGRALDLILKVSNWQFFFSLPAMADTVKSGSVKISNLLNESMLFSSTLTLLTLCFTVYSASPPITVLSASGSFYVTWCLEKKDNENIMELQGVQNILMLVQSNTRQSTNVRNIENCVTVTYCA